MLDRSLTPRQLLGMQLGVVHDAGGGPLGLVELRLLSFEPLSHRFTLRAVLLDLLRYSGCPARRARRRDHSTLGKNYLHHRIQVSITAIHRLHTGGADPEPVTTVRPRGHLDA